MVLGINIAVMILVMIIGKRAKQVGWKQLLIICSLALLQTLVAVYSMFQMEKPPLF